MSVPNPLPAFMPQNVRGRAVEELWHPSESFRAFWLRKGKRRKASRKEKRRMERKTCLRNCDYGCAVFITSRDTDLNLKKKIMFA